jgi:protein-S-isoprenylcysteine O-methyltransferase Ste14
MQIYGIHRKTTGAKCLITFAQVVFLFIAFEILKTQSPNKILGVTLFIALAIVFLRMSAMMFIWLPRGIGWGEAIGNSAIFGIYYLGFPLFALFSKGFSLPLYLSGLALFIAGSALNTSSELLRMSFRQRPENRGRLYTGGLFRYAVHINYFGEALWVLGLALISSNLFALVIPAILILVFVFSYIPNADAYLLKTYGAAFLEYRKRVKRFIPFVW